REGPAPCCAARPDPGTPPARLGQAARRLPDPRQLARVGPLQFRQQPLDARPLGERAPPLPRPVRDPRPGPDPFRARRVGRAGPWPVGDVDAVALVLLPAVAPPPRPPPPPPPLQRPPHP